MWNESRLKPYEGSPMPGEISVVRVPPPGAIAQGEPNPASPMVTGRQGNQLVTSSPVPVNAQTLARGQERYNIYCAPCHSRTGNGEGMIVQRGFPPPPDYALVRLKRAPLGHFYDVITNGYGVMYSYAHSVPVADRWAIANYIRVLQSRRPDVTQDVGQAARERARQRGIQDPSRPLRTPEPGAAEHGAPSQHTPESPAVPAPTLPQGGGTEIEDPIAPGGPSPGAG